MNFKWLVVGGILLIGMIFGISIGGTCLSWYTKENTLRVSINSKTLENEVVFDNVWKTISQKVQVSDDYRKSFQEIYVGMAEGRYPKGDGTMMKWVQESNPNFDITLFKSVMNSIEGLNATFTENQRQLIDLGKQHDIILTTPPASFFYGLIGKTHIDLKLVTSTRTQNAFATGKNDNIDIHSK